MTNPTAELLWAACRPSPDGDEVATAIAHGAEVDLAAELAVAQRISPLLYRALKLAGVSPISDILERDAHRCHAQSRMLLPMMGRLALKPLADAGIEALVVKGGALAPRYPDADLRPMDDIDLIVPESQINATITTLNDAGWDTHTPPHRRRYQLDLTHTSLPGLHIDLHRDLSNWRTRSNRLTSDTLWAARQRTELYGAPAYVLPPELELVMLAAHAAKPYHGFDRLIWIVDVAVASQAGLDWAQVTRIADDAHSRVAVAVALTLATRLGVESPDSLRQIDDFRTRALAAVLSPDWPVTSYDSELRATLRYALIDDRRTRAALVVSELFDKNVWDVPVRAARLMRRRLR